MYMRDIKLGKDFLNPFYAEKEDQVLIYRFHCPGCGGQITILVPVEPKQRGCSGITCPCCSGFTATPSVEEYVADRAQRKLVRKKFPHDELNLNNDMMGAIEIYPLYTLYPEVEGETSEVLERRLISYALEKCADLMTAEPQEKETIVSCLVKRSHWLNCVARAVVELYGNADQAGRERMKSVIEDVTEKITGTALMSELGQRTREAASLPDTPSPSGKADPYPMSFDSAEPSGMVAFQSAAFSGENKQKTTDGEERRCPCCNSPIRGIGKFCPECGNLL